jgi:hypothetical protein
VPLWPFILKDSSQQAKNGQILKTVISSNSILKSSAKNVVVFLHKNAKNC